MLFQASVRLILSFCQVHAEQAACLGVWIHSRAGALAARKYGRTAMLPRDILESIPAAILELESPDTFCESNI